jgi:hypothetical protein
MEEARSYPCAAARPRRRPLVCARRGALLAGALIAALALLGGSADAVIVHINGGPTLSYQPLRHARARTFDEVFSNLDYNGGPIMPSNTNYAVYWAPGGSPEYPTGYQTGLNRYFKDLAADSGGVENVESVSAQYNDAAGQFARYESTFGGALVDTDPYPANGCSAAPICLTDAQLRSELTKFVKSQGLPADLTHEYFLLTPPKVEDCFTSSGAQCSAGALKGAYCAYHGDVPLPGGVLVYANDPYVTGNTGCDDGNHPNNLPSDGAIEGGLSHEHNESITDPEPNNAWTDIGGSGGEVGDKCRTFEAGSEYGTALGTAEDGAKYNQVIDGDDYWYQQEWSNQGHRCLQRLSFSGERPTASFTSAAATGTEVGFDASASTAPGGVTRYDWQFNDGPGLAFPVETTSPTISHVFPEAGVYDVALTVYAADGSNLGAARTVIVGNVPAPAITKVSPSKGPAAGGATVTITGTHISTATEVTFGGVRASFFVKSEKQLVAQAPAGATGAVDVRVTTPGGTSSLTSLDHYTYVPQITGLSPAGGGVLGATSVTVSGSGFAPGTTATVFHFGSAKAPSVSCASTTSCTVTAPKHEAGIVDVKATVAKLSNPREAGDHYTYS